MATARATMATARVSCRRRVVITGVGVVSCLGVGVHHVWQQLIGGKTGVTAIEKEGFSQIPSKVAGFVPEGEEEGCFNSSLLPNVELKAATRMTQFSLAASEEALTIAKWKPDSIQEKERTGVCIGTGMVPLEEIVDAGQQLRGESYRRISPWFIPRILVNMAAGYVSLAYGFQGPNHAVSTACTTGLHALGDASRFIQHGEADVIICGGCEASVTPLGMAGFARMRALSTNFNSSPQLASRPFDAQRDGFVMSEGAAVMVLEELEHAKNRGADIYAEVLGYGLSGDANHLTAPCKDGSGARRCMEVALRDANIQLEDIGHINCHATSTPLGDAAESKAISEVFGSHCENILINSTKGATGHLLGAAGSIEAVFTALSIYSGLVPPTVNLEEPDTGYGLNYVRDKASNWILPSRPRIALTNSFGFGGTNATLCLSEYLDKE